VYTDVTDRISMNIGDDNLLISLFFPYSTLYLNHQLKDLTVTENYQMIFTIKRHVNVRYDWRGE
jgi:hypothetical protein